MYENFTLHLRKYLKVWTSALSFIERCPKKTWKTNYKISCMCTFKQHLFHKCKAKKGVPVRHTATLLIVTGALDNGTVLYTCSTTYLSSSPSHLLFANLDFYFANIERFVLCNIYRLFNIFFLRFGSKSGNKQNGYENCHGTNIDCTRQSPAGQSRGNTAITKI